MKKIAILLPLLFIATFLVAQESNPALLFFKNAETFRAQKKFTEAIAEYDHALALDQNLVQAYYFKGLSQTMIKDFEGAAQSYEKAIELQPENMKAYQALKNNYSALKNTGMMVETLVRMSDNTQDKKTQIMALSEAANVLVDQYMYHRAQEVLKKARLVDPSNSQFVLLDIQTLNGLGHYHKAITEAQKLASTLQDSDIRLSVPLHYELGYAYHQTGKYDESRKIFEKANFGPYRQKIFKLTPQYFFGVASGYATVYDYETAENLLSTAIEIDPSFVQGNMLLAELAIKQEHHHKAIHYYEKAIEGVKDDDESTIRLFNDLMEILVNSKKFDEAIQVADRALAAKEDQRNIKYLKAIAQFKKGEFNSAIEVMTALINEPTLSNLEQTNYRFALGLIHAKNNQPDKAIAFLNSAAKGPYVYPAQYALELISEEEAKAVAKHN